MYRSSICQRLPEPSGVIWIRADLMKTHTVLGERTLERIVCACDAWSAMTTDRSYRKARSASEAATELRASSGTHFDPRVVDALVKVLEV